MLMQSSAHGISRNLQAAIRAILETDGEGEATGHFTVRLRLRGPGPNCTPTDHVREVLRGDRVEHFTGNRQAKIGNCAEEATRNAKALGDAVTAVQIRIVNQAFPADCCARFFKIDPHDNKDLIFHLFSEN